MANTNLVTVDQLVSGLTKGKEYTDTAIAQKMSGVFKFAGSVEGTSLPTPSAENLGYVYNVSTAFTTNANFVEPSGQEYPAGTNIAVASPSSDTYKLDVLAGFMDLSDLVTDSNIATDQEVDDALNDLFGD